MLDDKPTVLEDVPSMCDLTLVFLLAHSASLDCTAAFWIPHLQTEMSILALVATFTFHFMKRSIFITRDFEIYTTSTLVSIDSHSCFFYDNLIMCPDIVSHSPHKSRHNYALTIGPWISSLPSDFKASLSPLEVGVTTACISSNPCWPCMKNATVNWLAQR